MPQVDHGSAGLDSRALRDAKILRVVMYQELIRIGIHNDEILGTSETRIDLAAQVQALRRYGYPHHLPRSFSMVTSVLARLQGPIEITPDEALGRFSRSPHNDLDSLLREDALGTSPHSASND
jgi:hypothetical protein